MEIDMEKLQSVGTEEPQRQHLEKILEFSVEADMAQKVITIQKGKEKIR